MAQYDINLVLGQSLAMPFIPVKTQTEIDALNPDLSTWQKQWIPTYNDGAVKYQNIVPKDCLVNRDFLQIWAFQNKWGEVYTDVTTSYNQPSTQQFVPYTFELNSDGKLINSFFYNNNSGVYNYPAGWDYYFGLKMYKKTSTPQRFCKIAVGATGFNNEAQNWKKVSVSKPEDNLYQRVIDEIIKIKTYSSANGDTVRKWRIHWRQGEANNTTAIATYKDDLLEALEGWIDEIGVDVDVIIAKTWLNSDGSGNAGIAQLELADENDYIYCFNPEPSTTYSEPGDFSNSDMRVKYPRAYKDGYHKTLLGEQRYGLDMGDWAIANVTNL